MHTSAYRKLRLAPNWVKAQLEKAGFDVTVDAGLSGMQRLSATLREPSDKTDSRDRPIRGA